MKHTLVTAGLATLLVTLGAAAYAHSHGQSQACTPAEGKTCPAEGQAAHRHGARHGMTPEAAPGAVPGTAPDAKPGMHTMQGKHASMENKHAQMAGRHTPDHAAHQAANHARMTEMHTRMSEKHGRMGEMHTRKHSGSPGDGKDGGHQH